VRRLKLVKAAPALTPAHRLLLREIVDFLGNADTCWPSLRLLAHNCGLTTRRIRQLLRDLERGGWIATRPRLRTDGGRTSSEYHWLATAPDHGAAEATSTTAKITTTPTATRSTTATPEARTPRRWLTIDPAQFSSPAEALRVYRATVAAGLLTTAEADRLAFFAAWCYCSRRHRTGKVTHPERMMQFLLRRPQTLRAIPAAEDEQKAREAIRRLFH